MRNKPKDLLTTDEAAIVLHVTPSRVRQLLGAGTLKGKRYGRDWLISRDALDEYRKEGSRS